MPRQELLTLDDVLAELRVARSTFYKWKATNKAPRCVRLPNGELRVRRNDLDAFLDQCTEEPAPLIRQRSRTA